MTRHYQTARAFRAALEDRLNQQAREAGQDLTRLRRLVGFERFLARLFAEEHPPWLLKGGYAFELRRDWHRLVRARLAPSHAKQPLAVSLSGQRSPE